MFYFTFILVLLQLCGALKTWFNRLLRHPAMKWSGSILGHKTHAFTYLLSPDPHRGTEMGQHLLHVLRVVYLINS